MHEDTGAADGVDATSPSKATEVYQEPSLATVPFQEGFHRSQNFSCPKSARVEKFLREDRRRLAGPRLANIFVLTDSNDAQRILGYYCLSAGHIERDMVSNRLKRDIPRTIAPMALLGFMGRDESSQKGVGEILLADAAIRLSRPQDLAVWGIMLHAENRELARWYAAKGFKNTPEDRVDSRNELLMYAPLDSLLP